MMKDSSVKTEDYPFPMAASSYSFLDHYSMSHDESSSLLREVLEYSELGDRSTYTTGSTSLGFMELLNMPEYLGPNSFFDMSVPSPSPQQQQQQPLDGIQLTTVTTTTAAAPATPNSSSISSESNDERTKEAALDAHHQHDEDEDDEDEDEDDNKTEKQLVDRSLVATSFIYLFN